MKKKGLLWMTIVLYLGVLVYFIIVITIIVDNKLVSKWICDIFEI
jgi:hypothetical protein